MMTFYRVVFLCRLQAFYNIFLYFQSQFLTRLCLIIRYAEQSGLRYINGECIRFRKNLHINTETLGIRINENLRQANRQNAKVQEDRAKTDTIASTDIRKMKRSSMDVLCRLIAIVNQYQNTDDQIQALDMGADKQRLMNLLNEMNRVNESLCACHGDFETLKLIYSKCLMKTLDLPIETERNRKMNELASSSNAEQNGTSNANVENPVDEECKEYFAMRDNKDDGDSDSDNENGRSITAKWYDELDNVDVKLARSFFAPVLKQLKTKIDPIKEEMKERELRYLLSKGFDRDEIINFDNIDSSPAHAHSNRSNSERVDDSTVDDTHIKAKPNRFDEMRALLEQKQQFQFLPLQNLPSACGSEDVLE